jgi:hypothetical protein
MVTQNGQFVNVTEAVSSRQSAFNLHDLKPQIKKKVYIILKGFIVNEYTNYSKRPIASAICWTFQLSMIKTVGCQILAKFYPIAEFEIAFW